jgi:hypothetical protein
MSPCLLSKSPAPKTDKRVVAISGVAAPPRSRCLQVQTAVHCHDKSTVHARGGVGGAGSLYNSTPSTTGPPSTESRTYGPQPSPQISTMAAEGDAMRCSGVATSTEHYSALREQNTQPCLHGCPIHSHVRMGTQCTQPRPHGSPMHSHVRMGTGAPLLRAGRVDPLQGLHLCLGHGPDDGQVRVLLIKLSLGVVHPHLPTTRGGCTQVNKSARGTVWVQRSLGLPLHSWVCGLAHNKHTNNKTM